MISDRKSRCIFAINCIVRRVWKFEMTYCSYCHRVSCLPIQKISRIAHILSNLKPTALITEFECESKAIAIVPFNRTNWMWKLSFMFLEIFNCNQISWHDVSPWILPNLCVRKSRCFSCFEGENSISDFRLQSGIPLDWMSHVLPVFVVDDDTSALTYEKITKLFALKKKSNFNCCNVYEASIYSVSI